MIKNVTTIQKEFLEYILRYKGDSTTSLEKVQIQGTIRDLKYLPGGGRERTFNKLRGLYQLDFIHWRRKLLKQRHLNQLEI